MTDNNNRSDPAKKDCTLSEEEIEQLALTFDPQICSECGHDHSFKNAKTSVDDFPVYLKNRISITIPIVGGNLGS
jgi:hypothetical protein